MPEFIPDELGVALAGVVGHGAVSALVIDLVDTLELLDPSPGLDCDWVCDATDNGGASNLALKPLCVFKYFPTSW